MMQHAIDPIQTQTSRPAAHLQPCPCGCAPCEEPCCGLECVERPRFYCGQLLGEDDLTALVDWTRSRLRRGKHHHGWGVVCGLGVRRDPQNLTGVIVGDGYAVDCCGEDVVLCAPETVDLTSVCHDEACLDPWRGQERAAGDTAGREDAPYDPELGGSNLEELIFAAAPVDLYLYYQEQHTHPETTLGNCGCGGEPGCEFSRTREGYRLIPRPVDPAQREPEVAAHNRWIEAYRREQDLLQRFIQEINAIPYGSEKDGSDKRRDELRAKLSRWIKLHPLHRFCFVEEWLANWEAIDETRLSQLMFWLAFDYHLHLVECACPCCPPETGIPLARVWLSIPDYRRDRKCRVLFIDDQPPFRRPIRRDPCRPLPIDCLDQAELLWRRRDDVERDYAADFNTIQPPSVADLEKWLSEYWNADGLCAPSGGRLRLAVIDAGQTYGERVVGFSRPT